eukprot:CAMPEP_0182442120 /NCGR_PEP_ID=MMETSP1172-20130603/1082_1 /TAXON_ID=708627 /ORGANISM="Timspurckia oligopyrenoides, Strain CCMP3278" /LENGTH=953 /DNA_ID=CAMNT_0024636827 /DNA_START=279 /DNA_END=3140 /DNA_ORIENTATION=+
MGSGGKITLILRIHYYTDHGSYICAVGPDPSFGSDNVSSALKLSPGESGYWHGSTTISLSNSHPDDRLVYKYVVVWPHKKRYEAVQTVRYASLKGLKDGDVLVSHDSFRAPNSNVFVTTCFTEAIFGPRGLPKLDSMLGDKSIANDWRRNARNFDKDPNLVAVRLVVLVPRLHHGHTVHVTGSHAVFGEWNPDHKVHLLNLGQHLYGAIVYIPREHLRDKQSIVEYKYAIYDEKDNLIFREKGTPRSLAHPENTQCKFFNIDETFEYVKPWKGTGVAIPVFSLRSEESMGIGEFLDLQPLVKWCNTVGMHLIQVLPVNDTGLDPSPYSANSVFALHPIYLRIMEVASRAYNEGKSNGGGLSRLMGGLRVNNSGDKSNIPQELVDEIETATKKLNEYAEIEYELVLETKLNLLEKIYKETWKETSRSMEFRSWWSKNMDWLPAYACWKSLLETAEGEWDFTKWEKSVKDVPSMIDERSPIYSRVCFFYFVQYHLHLQLKASSDFAKQHGVAIKGDLPIGVARYSSDTWTNPQDFLMDWSAGAPAFMGAAQNWDFPLYNWEVMASNNYTWWRKRLSHMAQYFQAFRIDHVLGFFRIWAIPVHNWTGLLGHLEPCKPVHISELNAIGIHDIDRLTNPYIRWWMLEKSFGHRARQIADQFMVDKGSGVFEFKKEFSTVASIGEALPVSKLPIEQEDLRKDHEFLRNELWALIDNVIAVRSEKHPESEFYLTCHMYHTTSYHHFGPQDAKDRLAGIWHNFFWERQNWRKEGEARLGALQDAAKMMVCAEDLGAVPPEAYEVLDELGILGLRIQRWPQHGSFGFPNDYGYLTIATPSCHDCSTVRGWWEEDRGRCHDYYRTFFGSDPPHSCETWVSRKVVESHLGSSSMWTVIPIQDLVDMEPSLRSENPMKDAINRPGESDGCWKFRTKYTIEELLSKTEFNKSLFGMNQNHGRIDTY